MLGEINNFDGSGKLGYQHCRTLHILVKNRKQRKRLEDSSRKKNVSQAQIYILDVLTKSMSTAISSFLQLFMSSVVCVCSCLSGKDKFYLI
jgi:hypothetical protein